MDVLSSAATKRDAKAFITRLKKQSSAQKPEVARLDHQNPRRAQFRPEVNLGSFFGSTTAVRQSPQFDQYHPNTDKSVESSLPAYHVALVQLVGPENLEQEVIQGIALTLSQLCRLGMTPCLLIESTKAQNHDSSRKKAMRQAGRLAEAISGHGVEARVLDCAFIQTISTSSLGFFSRKSLVGPIETGKIPIILPYAYSHENSSIEAVEASDAILALSQELTSTAESRSSGADKRAPECGYGKISLDRLIVLDSQGGIPNPALPGSAHVFLNMDQEFNDVRNQLLEERATMHRSTLQGDKRGDSESADRPSDHLQHLEVVQKLLATLPGSSSAIITTPADAARSSAISSGERSISVGTRRRKNPLIYNLLTDKPIYSASLPRDRLGQVGDAADMSTTQSTFAKRGMALTMIPDPRVRTWTTQDRADRKMRLSDTTIDLDRLVYLINDSFNRKLDVEKYLGRVDDRMAGIIIAGEYEGAAIFTWETPPGVVEDDRQVPYLDKFAVLKRSQGSGGVADFLFNAMVRGCLPKGVCWRSRRDNPVNKWYFERARGTWKIPASNWTMFWTTEGVEAGRGQRFLDYEAVCRTVKPTWADDKAVED